MEFVILDPVSPTSVLLLTLLNAHQLVPLPGHQRLDKFIYVSFSNSALSVSPILCGGEQIFVFKQTKPNDESGMLVFRCCKNIKFLLQ